MFSPITGKESNVATPVDSKKTYLETLSETTESVQKSASDIEGGIKATKETYAGAKSAVASGVNTVKKSARTLRSKLPRSRKEANQMAYKNGEGVMEWLREKTAELAENNKITKNSQKSK